MQQAFYFDQSRCIGCNTCVVACKDWNGVAPGPAAWRRLEVLEHGVFPAVQVFNMLISCFHCRRPSCIRACASAAITKLKVNGVVVVDRHKCTGTRACLPACPYGAPQFGDDLSEPDREDGWKVAHPMQKCHFCVDRLEAGKKPVCVDACIVRALDAGPEEEILTKYPEAKRAAVGLPNSIRRDGDLQPAIYFKPKPVIAS